MIRIRLPDTSEATLEAGCWQATDTRLASLLNAMRRPWHKGTPSGDSEWNEAQIVSRVLGATIIEQN